MNIAIIGGGIVGLTTALSLNAAGLRATVYEAVDELKPLGVGINLLPHAVRELAELGLLEKLKQIGVAIDGLDYHMGDGRKVWSEPRGLSAGYRWPQIAIHRGKFQLFLRDEVVATQGANAIRPGHELAQFEQDDAGVSLQFRGIDQPMHADIAIGADGIHSALRRQLFPGEGKPLWNGVSLFRATTRMPAREFGARMLWAGHSVQKFIAYPIVRQGDDLLLNWVCDLRTAEPGGEPFEDWNRTAGKELLIKRYRDWRCQGIDITAIIEAAGDVFEFPMVDRDPLPRWSFDRVTLAGDAAHPMYPIGSNGATQGIIDARALAYYLASGPDPVTALADYEQARREATARIVLGNRAGGPDKVLELAIQRARDPATDLESVLPMTERETIAREYKQLAGFDPDVLNQRPSFSVEPQSPK
ncbi:MAG: FAD-dependent monooxygenase [Novosphingobium sp.]|nr:FAD-dependent monooxygenase [Novosphingobium sp.]